MQNEQMYVLINIRYLLDVNENIHHFDVAFYRMMYRFLLIARNDKQTNKKKRKEKACTKTEISNKNNKTKKKTRRERKILKNAN